MLAAKKIKTQKEVLPWIRAQVAGKRLVTQRRELSITKPGLPDVRIVSTDKEPGLSGH